MWNLQVNTLGKRCMFGIYRTYGKKDFILIGVQNWAKKVKKRVVPRESWTCSTLKWKNAINHKVHKAPEIGKWASSRIVMTSTKTVCLCIYVFVYLCVCAFTCLCLCVFVYLCVFVCEVQSGEHYEKSKRSTHVSNNRHRTGTQRQGVDHYSCSSRTSRSPANNDVQTTNRRTVSVSRKGSGCALVPPPWMRCSQF